MGTEKYYTIKVGISEPQEIEVGQLDKKTGLPKGPTEKAVSVLGLVSVPNYTKAWGKRTLGKDGKPTGEVTFLEWGAEGGEIIEVRALSACKSIDKQYQDSRKLFPTESEYMIDLHNGLNNFDPVTQASLVQLLKIHSMNTDSKSCNPTLTDKAFEEYDQEKVVSKELSETDILYNALDIVMSIKDNAKRLRVFAEIYGIDPQKQDKIILQELIASVKKNPSLFLKTIEEYHQEVQRVLVRANDLQLLNLGSPGDVILTTTDKPIISGLDKNVNGHEKLVEVIHSALEPAIYDAITKIKAAITTREKELS